MGKNSGVEILLNGKRISIRRGNSRPVDWHMQYLHITQENNTLEFRDPTQKGKDAMTFSQIEIWHKCDRIQEEEEEVEEG